MIVEVLTTLHGPTGTVRKGKVLNSAIADIPDWIIAEVQLNTGTIREIVLPPVINSHVPFQSVPESSKKKQDIRA